MASVLNRTTKEYRQSVNTPDFPVAAWIINPDLSAVSGFPSKYWVIAGDAVSLMSPAERSAVDAAELEAARDAVTAQLDAAEDVLRAFALVMLDEFNARALKVNEILDAIDAGANVGAIKNNIAAVLDYPQHTTAQIRVAVRAKLGS